MNVLPSSPRATGASWLGLLLLVLAFGSLPPRAAQGQQATETVAAEVPTPPPSAQEVRIGSEEPAAGGTVPAAEAGETFIHANTAYEAGDAAKAVQLYRTLLEQGYSSTSLHYNLGNAYLRDSQLGRAIASYRRSELLAPRDQDVQANLSFARRSIKDAIAPPAPSPLARILFFWHTRWSRRQLAWTVVVLNILFWSLLALRLFRRGSEILRWSTLVTLLLLLATGTSLGLRLSAPSRVAVVVPQEIEARNAPEPTAVVRFQLHAGTEIPIREDRQTWLRIELPDGQQGWIETAWVEIVEL